MDCGVPGYTVSGCRYSRAQLSLLPSLAVRPSTLKRMAAGEGFEDLKEIASFLLAQLVQRTIRRSTEIGKSSHMIWRIWTARVPTSVFSQAR